jgi:hypothetical protein
MNEKINRKYCCEELADLILNINDFSRQFMPTRGGGSLQEWMNYFGLPERGITLRGLFRFLKDRCCIEKCKDKNMIRLNHETLLELRLNLRKELGKKRGRR